MDQQHNQLLKTASIASISIAAILIVLKLFTFLITDSVSILASLIDSIMDSMVSIISFFAIRYSLMPADEEHRFGHGKAEAIAGFNTISIYCRLCCFFIHPCYSKIIKPSADSALAILALSSCVFR